MQNFSYKNEVDLHENKPVGGKTFSYEWFRSKIRVDTEAKSNLELAYSKVGKRNNMHDSIYISDC